MLDERKAISDITRKDWICFQWNECTELGDDDRMFFRGQRRMPDEAAQAAEEWDYTADDRDVGE